MAATGPIATFGAITAGLGYLPGTYPRVALTGGSGSGAIATLTVAGGGNVISVVVTNPSTHQQIDRSGKNYQVGDSLSASPSFDGIGHGSGFHVAVATLAPACENCFYGKIVPLTAPSNVAGLRFCGFGAFVNSQQPQPNFQPSNPNTWLPNITADDYWCGEGIDGTTLVSFSSGTTQLPSTAFSGQTGLAPSTNGVSTYAVTYGGNLAKFFLFPADHTSEQFLKTHGIEVTIGVGVNLGKFNIISSDGTNFTGAESYWWLGMP